VAGPQLICGGADVVEVAVVVVELVVVNEVVVDTTDEVVVVVDVDGGIGTITDWGYLKNWTGPGLSNSAGQRLLARFSN
jgi:hypothetical protein